jgi:transposase InsO family protein
MCQLYDVSRSGYYDWLNASNKQSERAKEDATILKEIEVIYADHQKRYGVPRIHQALRDKQIRCGKNRVSRLMRSANLYGLGKRRFRITTISQHGLPIAPNLLNREFAAPAINQRWVTDITYIRTLRGWLYLVVIIDLFSRKVVGWATSRRLTHRFVVEAVSNAIENRRPPKGLILHSDRGIQYASKKYQELLAANDVLCSMSRKGNCWDNAPAESFFRTLKRELIGKTVFASQEAASLAIFEYIEVYYNRKRMHSTIQYLSPENYEKMSFRA